MSRPFPLRLFMFAFLGWTFDFYDLVLFGFIKDAVSHDLGLSHKAEPWLLGVALSTSGRHVRSCDAHANTRAARRRLPPDAMGTRARPRSLGASSTACLS